MKNLSALISGIIFGFGLLLSGMTDTAKVIRFLDIFGRWDPDLMFVMGSALIVSFLGFKIIFHKLKVPLFDTVFSIPTNTIIDKKLLLGAFTFGTGWGMYGYCPGPALASIIYLDSSTFLFIATMVVGLFIGDSISRKLV